MSKGKLKTQRQVDKQAIKTRAVKKLMFDCIITPSKAARLLLDDRYSKKRAIEIVIRWRNEMWSKGLQPKESKKKK